MLAYVDLPLLCLARYFKKDEFEIELAGLHTKRNRKKKKRTRILKSCAHLKSHLKDKECENSGKGPLKKFSVKPSATAVQLGPD